MEINACDACDACQAKPYGGCIVEDDMQEIYPALQDAGAVVIASPVYWFTVTAQTKLFMDRCYARVDADAYSLSDKEIGIIMTYGDSDPFNSGAINALRTFQDGFSYAGSKIVGMVYGSASDPGEIKDNAVLMAEAYELGKKLGSSD